jgi:branched-chain amino acid transport system substrate-binding protein
MASAPPPTFGQLLKRYRTTAGLTQEALAERAGLSARGISDMERGLRHVPYRDTISRLAQALQLSAAERAQFEAAARRRSATSGRTIPSNTADRLAIPPQTPTAAPGTLVSATASSRSADRGPLSVAPRLRDILVAPPVRAVIVGILLVGILFPTGIAGLQSRIAGGALCLATEFPTSNNNPMYGGPWAKSLEDAVQLAVQQHQALGNGYTLVMKPYHEIPAEIAQADPQTAAQNVTDMVKEPCIVGMVGPAWSVVALAEMPIAAKAGLVMISPANTMPALTLRQYAPGAGVDFDRLHPPGKKTNYFRTIATDVFQGQELAAFTSRLPPDGLGARSAFVIDDHQGNEALIGGFTQEFLATGGEIVGTASIPFDGAARITDLVPRIVGANPEVVVYGGVTEEGGGLLKTRLVQAGYQGYFVGGDGIAKDPAFIEQIDATAAKGIFAIDPVPEPSQLRSNVAARFVQDFHARYPGEILDGYGANAYDAAMALITAIARLIQQGQAVTRETVLDQVQSIQTQGVTGPIAFDHNGDSAHGAFSVYTVKDGRWVWLRPLSV